VHDVPASPDGDHDTLEDRLPRLPLLTITASRVGRAMALKFLRQRGSAGGDPHDVADYLDSTIGWRPGEHTLYRRILLHLAGKDRVPQGGHKLEPVVHVHTWGGVNHRQTRYYISPAGLALLDEETREMIGPNAPLSSAIIGLQHLTRLVSPDGPRLGLIVNTNVLLRWLVLHTLVQIGACRVPEINAFVYGCAGQISYEPQGKEIAEDWPLEQAIRRAAKELLDPARKLWGVARQGSQLCITETGKELYHRWRPDLGESLRKARFMAESAHVELSSR